MLQCIDLKESWGRSTPVCRSSMPEGMAMRFVSSRWLHSLAARLLGTYVAALMLTTCFVAGALWFRFNQDVSVTTQAQLRQASNLLHRSIRFDSAGLPVVVMLLPSDLSWVYHDFAADLKYRVLDVSGRVIL